MEFRLSDSREPCSGEKGTIWAALVWRNYLGTIAMWEVDYAFHMYAMLLCSFQSSSRKTRCCGLG